MVTDVLVLDSNFIRGKCLQYRLNREARCDYARTPQAAFEHISAKLRSGGNYEVVVMSADQVRFGQGIECIFRTYGPREGGPDFVVMTGGSAPEADLPARSTESSGRPGRAVRMVSGPLAASRAVLGH